LGTTYLVTRWKIGEKLWNADLFKRTWKHFRVKLGKR